MDRPSLYSPPVNGIFSPAGTQAAMPSPLIDAMDSPLSKVVPRTPEGSPDISEGSRSVVKIGQTDLHNAGGRSSWIGL